MRAKILQMILMLITLLFCSFQVSAANLQDLARTALQRGPSEAAEAVSALRQAGPAGMEAMLETGGAGEALDRVCGVRDCADIRLFWYTDLEAAKAAARASGKPILTLRLLGRLDEELSCANSRFFRTVFYKNSEINQLLRDQFVLHWRSVRPVPKVTIDFGDGTRLERTITGNSIHYVLDSHGRLVDALPGLSGPDSFEKALQDAAEAARRVVNLDDTQFQKLTRGRHNQQLYARAEAFRRDLAALAPRKIAPAAYKAEPTPRVVTAAAESEKIPTARDPWAVLQTTPGVLTDRINVGGNETGSKSSVEDPILRALRQVSNDDIDRLAKLRRSRVRLDAASKAFLIRKQGVTDPREADRLVDNFETAVARDEVLNDYRTGPAILRELLGMETLSGGKVEVFNEWVYEEVFKAPLSDPWLGLAPDDVYTALPAATRSASRQPVD